MDPQWVVNSLFAIVLVLCGFVARWFKADQKSLKDDIAELRKELGTTDQARIDERLKRVEQLDPSRDIAEILRNIAELQVKSRRMEADYQVQHDWKTKIFPQMQVQQNENIFNVVYRIESDMNRRMERVEKKVLNGHKE